MSAHAIPRITPEQYLAIERAAEIKSEYYDGQMFAMSGGTAPHSFIAANLIFALGTALRGRNCRVSTSDLRVRVSPAGPFVYPDAAVVCGQLLLADDYKDTMLNPAVVFEVLSKSSEAYDRGFKFAQCRTIESLREYVLVSQTEPRLEVFLRLSDGSWNLREFVGMDAVCHLAGIDCNIALADVYEGVTLEP